MRLVTTTCPVFALERALQTTTTEIAQAIALPSSAASPTRAAHGVMSPARWAAARAARSWTRLYHAMRTAVVRRPAAVHQSTAMRPSTASCAQQAALWSTPRARVPLAIKTLAVLLRTPAKKQTRTFSFALRLGCNRIFWQGHALEHAPRANAARLPHLVTQLRNVPKEVPTTVNPAKELHARLAHAALP